MGSYNFEEDLAKTQQDEIIAVKKIEGRYGTKQVGEFGKDNKWDFVMTSTRNKEPPKSFEMKGDDMAADTGNIAIEYECRGKPSGISVSQSDYYLYLVKKNGGGDYWLIETSRLKECIQSQRYFRQVTGGDKGSNTKMYLFKLGEWKKYAHLLDI